MNPGPIEANDDELDIRDPQSAVRSVARALEIMSLLQEGGRPISLREIQHETRLARTTALRLLSTLEQFGLLWETGKFSYNAGPGLLRWAALAREGWKLPVDAARALRELVETTRESATIWVRQNVRRVCVAFEEGPQALRYYTRIGRELPLWIGANGRVLLRDLTEQQLLRVSRDSPDRERNLPLLREWQSQVAAQGYAVTHRDREDGMSVAAVPLVNHDRRVVATLGIAGPTDRFTDENVQRFLDALRTAAKTIESSGFMMMNDERVF